MFEDNPDCPLCNVEMARQSIVKYKNNGHFNIVGYEWYCTQNGCNYQIDQRGSV